MAILADGGRVRVSCSWCHELVVLHDCPQYCPTCRHRADVARVDCDCPTCDPVVTARRLTPARLAQCVTDLAAAIAQGDVTPEWMTLRALAIICDENHLPAEAARVRSWMRTV